MRCVAHDSGQGCYVLRRHSYLENADGVATSRDRRQEGCGTVADDLNPLGGERTIVGRMVGKGHCGRREGATQSRPDGIASGTRALPLRSVISNAT